MGVDIKEHNVYWYLFHYHNEAQSINLALRTNALSKILTLINWSQLNTHKYQIELQQSINVDIQEIKLSTHYTILLEFNLTNGVVKGCPCGWWLIAPTHFHQMIDISYQSLYASRLSPIMIVMLCLHIDGMKSQYEAKYPCRKAWMAQTSLIALCIASPTSLDLFIDHA